MRRSTGIGLCVEMYAPRCAADVANLGAEEGVEPLSSAVLETAAVPVRSLERFSDDLERAHECAERGPWRQGLCTAHSGSVPHRSCGLAKVAPPTGQVPSGGSWRPRARGGCP